MTKWYIFPVLVSRTKKNLATLFQTSRRIIYKLRRKEFEISSNGDFGWPMAGFAISIIFLSPRLIIFFSFTVFRLFVFIAFKVTRLGEFF
jgi:hypothetical protein